MTDTVTITDPAKAREKLIVFDETLLVLSADFGWQKAIAAPRQVEAPAMQER
jgi:hypothetical protein